MVVPYRKESFFMDNKLFMKIEAEYGISALPENPVDAMAYVPFQQNAKTYSSQQGLVMGTIFPVLDKPFLGAKGGNEND